MIKQTRYFDKESDAIEYRDNFIEQWGGFGNPYEGRAWIFPVITPGVETTYEVRTERRRSAD